VELLKRANRQSILLVHAMHFLFIVNCVQAYINGKIPLAPLLVSIISGILNCAILLFIYRADALSKLIRYISLAGLYLTCIFRTHTDTDFGTSGHLVERLINCVPFNQKD